MNKLLYIANLRLPTEKAHGVQIMKSCEAFSQFAEVELVVPRLTSFLKKEPFSYYGIKNFFSIKKVPVLEALTLSKWVGNWVVYIQNISFSISAVLYILLKGKRKDPHTVLYSRDYITLFILAILGAHPVSEIHDYRTKNSKWGINFALKKCSMIMVNSEGTLMALRRHYPDNLNLKTAKVVPNGVDPQYFDIKETKEVARQKLGIDSNKKIIGYLGRLETAGREKGASEIIRSFLMANEDALLYVVGGPDYIVEKYRQGFNNNSKVVFCGQVDYSAVPLYLRSFDAVIIPVPEGELAKTTSPIKLFEYMASGKIIIAPGIPSITKFLNDNNSLLFNPNKEESLSEQIKVAINNKELAERLSKQSFLDARKYSWLERAMLILNLIKSKHG